MPTGGMISFPKPLLDIHYTNLEGEGNDWLRKEEVGELGDKQLWVRSRSWEHSSRIAQEWADCNSEITGFVLIMQVEEDWDKVPEQFFTDLTNVVKQRPPKHITLGNMTINRKDASIFLNELASTAEDMFLYDCAVKKLNPGEFSLFVREWTHESKLQRLRAEYCDLQDYECITELIKKSPALHSLCVRRYADWKWKTCLEAIHKHGSLKRVLLEKVEWEEFLDILEANLSIEEFQLDQPTDIFDFEEIEWCLEKNTNLTAIYQGVRPTVHDLLDRNKEGTKPVGIELGPVDDGGKSKVKITNLVSGEVFAEGTVEDEQDTVEAIWKIADEAKGKHRWLVTYAGEVRPGVMPIEELRKL